MVKRWLCIFVMCELLSVSGNAQLKFIVEDFEGYADGASDLGQTGMYTYGNLKISADSKVHQQHPYQSYAGKRALKMEVEGKKEYGGWGKGIGLFVDLDASKDYFNMYVNFPLEVGAILNYSPSIKISLTEDDNNSNNYEKEADDTWEVTVPIHTYGWQLVSVPLNKFKDANAQGDGTLNIGYKQGKLFVVSVSFPDHEKLRGKDVFYFDFLCFSKGKLQAGPGLFDAPAHSPKDHCGLGVWSKEDKMANFADIATAFENDFTSKKKLAVIHFFQPFGKEMGKTEHYPSVERINKVIEMGYIPMITLEDHFVTVQPNMKQPNLYSITEGHYDSFFGFWAHEIKQVKGTVMLRIFHEFNGNWYPWCAANNNNDVQLVAKAFRYVYNIFKQNNVTNVKFIWCPNSMSVPQEGWNTVMDAYPGDEYVDIVGLDIYNGAGKAALWRSFRKEGIENYFVLTEKLPQKPIIVCEAASRERKAGECSNCESKGEWIREMVETLESDMSRVKLLSWFNEKEYFRVNSSKESERSYEQNVIKNNYFSEGSKDLKAVIENGKTVAER
jgi:hypothetical protein